MGVLQGVTQTRLTAAIADDIPAWAQHKVKVWDENGFRAKEAFVAEKYWSSQHSINVFEVVGTAHPDYQGMTWLEFLAQGKRMKQNLLLQEQNPDYYLDEVIKLPTMYYVEIDGSGWHVNGDGNHRTCIARFMFQGMGRTMLHGVNVESYRTDQRAFAAFQRLRDAAALKRLPLVVEAHRKTLRREDTAGWMREYYEVKISVRDLQKGSEALLTPDEAEVYATKIEQPVGIRGLLSKLFGG